MKVLLTGASGYLGQHLIDELVRAGHTLCAAYGGLESFEAEYGGRCRVVKLDLAAAEQVARLIEDVQPDCVVNLAAISSPVGCDKDPERAMTINCPRALVEALPDSTTLCHLSTDQVFDGLAAPYVESSETAPVNTYGRSKLEFERLLSSALPTRSVCLRSSLILGGRTGGSCRKQSFLQFCDERLAAEGGADFFSDEYRSAVYVGDVVRLLAWFVAGGVARAPGIYNVRTTPPPSVGHPARARSSRRRAGCRAVGTRAHPC